MKNMLNTVIRKQTLLEFLFSLLPLIVIMFIAHSAYSNWGGILASFGRHEQARKILNAQLNRNPDNLIALSQRASLKLSTGQPDAALQDYSRALELDIAKLERWTIRKFGQSILLTERAQAYFALGDYHAAQEDLYNAHRIKPSLHSAIAWLGIVSFALEQHEQAHQWWQQAIMLYPRYGDLTQDKGISNVLGWHHPNETAQRIIAVLNDAVPPG